MIWNKRFSGITLLLNAALMLMNLELDKKVQEYKERLKDLEDRYLHVISELDMYQALMWDVENQNCEYEERFKKIA